MAERAVIFGASVRGPGNERACRANQDAWARGAGRFGRLVVVCDGLGSRPRSALGARAACRAARRAAALWPGAAGGADPRLLLRLLEVLWRLELGSHPPADCATTCLLALLDRDRHLLVAALGDGLALVQRAGGELLPVGGRPEADFADETLALGAPHRLADWRWILLAPGEARAVVLATDGVADDLHPGRLGEFLAWLLAEIAPLDPRTRRRRLQRELRRWPVPRHTDDKTVAVLRIAPEDEP